MSAGNRNKKCYEKWNPQKDLRPICSKTKFEGQIVKFISSGSKTCHVVLCTGKNGRYGILEPCKPLKKRWKCISGCLTKARGCKRSGRKFSEMHVFGARQLGLKPRKTLVCVNGKKYKIEIKLVPTNGIEFMLG